MQKGSTKALQQLQTTDLTRKGVHSFEPVRAFIARCQRYYIATSNEYKIISEFDLNENIEESQTSAYTAAGRRCRFLIFLENVHRRNSM